MKKILIQIRRELKANASKTAKTSAEKFFKEKLKCYGVKIPTVNKIGRKIYALIKAAGKNEIFLLCEELLKSGYIEERTIAFEWAEKQAKHFTVGDFKRLEKWIHNYVSNWAECDTFCNHTVAFFIEKFPEYIVELKKWAHSKNRWVKRASAVTLILPARHGKFLKDIFEIADILLYDADDMVQKGYGWMLKEASKAYEKEVFAYVLKHKETMPRTALRYAIEKMSEDLRKQAMIKSKIETTK